jgi:hypothetical protein
MKPVGLRSELLARGGILPMRVASSTLAFIAVLALGGCLAFEDPLNIDGVFLQQQQAFSADLRWEQWDSAAEHVEPALRPDFFALTEQLREVRLTDYEVRDVQIESLKTTATAVVVYRGFELSMPVERSVVVTQHWRWDEEARTWYVTPDIAAREKLDAAGFQAGRR